MEQPKKLEINNPILVKNADQYKTFKDETTHFWMQYC